MKSEAGTMFHSLFFNQNLSTFSLLFCVAHEEIPEKEKKRVSVGGSLKMSEADKLFVVIF